MTFSMFLTNMQVGEQVIPHFTLRANLLFNPNSSHDSYRQCVVSKINILNKC